MTVHRIYVDTEVLRDLSKSYLTRRNVFEQVGKSIQYAIQIVIDHMPDYDGRMQPAARNDALDFFTRCQNFSKGFGADSDLLLKTAEAFETVDGQTVRIIEECQGITSDACYIDHFGDTGIIVTTTETVITNPDGSTSTITVVRAKNPDGSVTTITTIKTVKVLDSKTAADWNQCDKVRFAVLMGVSFAILGAEIPEILAGAGYIALAKAAGYILDFSQTGLDIALLLSPPPDNWAEGDIITSTTTIITNEPAVTPDTPIPETSPLGPDITTEIVVTDSNGKIKSTDTTGIDPTGSPKSGTPPISN